MAALAGQYDDIMAIAATRKPVPPRRRSARYSPPVEGLFPSLAGRPDMGVLGHVVRSRFFALFGVPAVTALRALSARIGTLPDPRRSPTNLPADGRGSAAAA